MTVAVRRAAARMGAAQEVAETAAGAVTGARGVALERVARRIVLSLMTLAQAELVVAATGAAQRAG